MMKESSGGCLFFVAGLIVFLFFVLNHFLPGTAPVPTSTGPGTPTATPKP